MSSSGWRSRSPSVAQLRADVVRDLRSDSRVQEVLAEPGGFSPREQVVTPMIAPAEDEDLPPALLVVDAYSTSATNRKSATEISYEVEVGLTVTQGWIEYWTPNRNRSGTNPDLVADDIMDAVSERAHVMFNVPNLSMDSGGSGGSIGSPMPGGERAMVRSWLFSRTRG